VQASQERRQKMAKIGIFGGTFNPPHLGHVLAAREVKLQLGLDKILFVPDAEPPHKAVPQGSPGPEMRLRLVEAALQGETGMEVSGIELERPGKSYTSDTLRALQEKYPEDQLYLIMGSDMFLSLHTWHEPEVICSLAAIVGMHRKTEDRAEEFLAQKQLLEGQYGAKVFLVDNAPVEISSSRVRRMLVLGGAEHYVAPQVLELIRQEGLYGVDRDYRNLSDEDLRQVATALLKKKRVPHVLGCAETAVKLAKLYGADPEVALRAGLLHDVTKAIDGEDQLLLVDKYDIMISDFERKNPKLLHAKTGAAVAEHVFGESPEVVKAIYWHTTGKADMSLMEKIIYLADYMEPTRSFPGVERLRQVTFEDLDRGLLMGLELCIAELVRENKTVCSDSADARDYLRQQLGADTIMEG
jgi:nicotinate-nucleotide adenylyltransferase